MRALNGSLKSNIKLHSFIQIQEKRHKTFGSPYFVFSDLLGKLSLQSMHAVTFLLRQIVLG